LKKMLITFLFQYAEDKQQQQKHDIFDNQMKLQKHVDSKFLW
jgi:hypothetical protein